MFRAAVVALLATTATAHAGKVATANDAPDPTDHVPTSVRAHLEGATAVFSLRYHVDAGFGLERGLAILSVPRRGSVTGAVATVDGSVHRLALDPADHAGSVFEDLATRAAQPSRRWGVQIAMGSLGETVTVDVAAPHAAAITIDLEVSSPTCFVDEVRYAAVPKSWESLVPPSLRAKRDDVAALCDSELFDERAWIALASRELEAKPFGEQRLGMSAGRLDLPTDHIVHFELDVAQRISQVPPDLATVFLVDGSRSMTATQTQAQQAIIESYLKLAPRSRTQIVEYDRKAHALLPSWMPASQAGARVVRELGALPGNNGSNVDAGIAEAARWLARIDGTRRIVVFTDELLSDRLDAIDAATLHTGLPDGTLVHVVALGTDFGPLDRDDDVKLAALAKVTEGVSVHGRVDDKGRVDATMLVRPIAFEHVVATAPGWTELEVSGDARTCRFDDTLTYDEGTACDWWGHGGANAGPVKIEGVVWNHRIVRVLRPDSSAGLAMARTLSAHGTNLGEAVTLEIDRAARAVNTVWSLIGTWGGAGGYADLEPGGFGFGMSGCGCGGGSSDSVGIGHAGHLGVKLDLKAQLERGIAKCSRGVKKVVIDLELTLDEIVEVDVTADGAALHDCVVEAVWDTTIALGSPPPHAHTRVVFD